MAPGRLSPAPTLGAVIARSPAANAAMLSSSLPTIKIANAQAYTPLDAAGLRRRRHGGQARPRHGDSACRLPPRVRLEQRYGSLVRDTDCLRLIAATYASYKNGKLECGLQELSPGHIAHPGRNARIRVFGCIIDWPLELQKQKQKPISYRSNHVGLRDVQRPLQRLDYPLPSEAPDRITALARALHEALGGRIIEAVREASLPDDDRERMAQIEDSFPHATKDGRLLATYADHQQPLFAPHHCAPPPVKQHSAVKPARFPGRTA